MDSQYAAVCADKNLQFYRSLNLLALRLDWVGRGRPALEPANLKVRACGVGGIGWASNGAETGKDRDGWNSRRG